jgi:limonene-1,2-epoxide hydrolase
MIRCCFLLTLVAVSSAVQAQSEPVPVNTSQETGGDAATFQPTSKIYDFFNDTNAGNLKAKVEAFYGPTIEFEDPFTKLQGRAAVLAYYTKLFADVKELTFDIKTEFQSGDETVAVWTMTMKHPAVAGGETVIVDGVSYVRFEGDKAVYHRDYFDAGAMVYEHVPIVGSIVRYVKGRVAQE